MYSATRQQDMLKGWLQIVKKKTARLSTRITANLGLISLTRDENFERHHQNFKHIEKTIKSFIKNLSTFVDHFENFLLALQNTSDNLADFYRDRSHRRELEELRRKNKALACEHFHAFRRTVDRQVIAVSNQVLLKFAGPHQLIKKRSAKLLDYDNKTKEVESCRDSEKKTVLQEQHVIAKDIYEKINQQLILELPKFNQFALEIFKECIMVLLETRRNLILSYTRHTASLLDTPLMSTYTASDVVSSILMSCDPTKSPKTHTTIPDHDIHSDQERKDSGQTSGHDTRQSSPNVGDASRPQSRASQLSSEFDNLAIERREICSTPISQNEQNSKAELEAVPQGDFDEPDGDIELPEGPRNSSFKASDINDSLKDDGHTTNENSDYRATSSAISNKQKSKDKRKKRKFQIYVAAWAFEATGPNQLTIAGNQPLKLIKPFDESGNPDWSLVQDKKGQLGYVPSTYIKKKE